MMKGVLDFDGDLVRSSYWMPLAYLICYKLVPQKKEALSLSERASLCVSR